MKLNIQFMLRSLQMEDTEKFKERFRAVSGMLIEQIDNMAAIASAFSDFAKMSEAHNETFEVDELVRNCSLLFKIIQKNWNVMWRKGSGYWPTGNR